MRYAAICALAVVLACPGAIVHAADDKDVIKEIKSKLDATVAGVTDFTVRQESKTLVAGKEVAATVWSRFKGTKYRVEIEAVGNVKRTIIFDGRDTWMLGQGAPEKMPAKGGSGKGAFWWRGIPDAARVEGTEKLGDRDCYLIKYQWTENDPSVAIWVDKENLRLLKMENNTAALTATTTYSDYKKVRGDWEFAHKSESQIQSANKNPMQRSTAEVKSIEVNTGLADELFDATAAK